MVVGRRRGQGPCRRYVASSSTGKHTRSPLCSIVAEGVIYSTFNPREARTRLADPRTLSDEPSFGDLPKALQYVRFGLGEETKKDA
jgi:hypothetical protein